MRLIDTIDRALLAELREMTEDREYCCMHNVASDGNIENRSIEWCLANGGPGNDDDGRASGKSGESCCDTCREYGEALLAIPVSLRRMVIHGCAQCTAGPCEWHGGDWTEVERGL